MVVLKKVKASTLMETMVATVLIVIIFMMTSMVMNSLLSAQLKFNVQPVHAHMQKLEYLYAKQKIQLPYIEEWEHWEIQIKEQQENGTRLIVFEATDEVTQRKVTHYIRSNE